MKKSILIFSIFIIACSAVQKNLNSSNSLYFYFDDNSELMRKNYSGYERLSNKGIGNLKYNFILDSTNLIFIAKNKATRNKPKRIIISNKDTVGLNIKNIEWLNTFTNNWRNIVKLRNTNDDIYIIEKDTIDDKLYLINVVYTEEIE